jgi:uncharacterized protein (TIGR02145 family)
MTKKRLFSVTIIALLLSLMISSCEKTETTDPTKVTASFTTDKESGDSPLSIKFTNTSNNATTYLWNFGDGTATSTEKDPTHTFTNTSTTSVASITVTLTSTGEDNTIANTTKVITVNKSGNITNGLSTAEFNNALTYGTMTDQDGNVYKTITIGTQTWMAENLRTTKYRDGTAIHNVTDNTAWVALTTGAYCTYNNTTDTVVIATYGRLYNWYAATDAHNIAPTGWHLPTDAEWTTLTTYLGGESVAGGKMKETGTSHWITPNAGATNESGFTTLPSGGRFSIFSNVGFNSYFWSNTRSRYLYSNLANVDCADVNKSNGFTLRLIKD